MRLIDADDLKTYFEIQYFVENERVFDIPQIKAFIDIAPTVEAKPMIHGYNRHEEYKGYCEFWCSECGFLIFEYHEGDDDIREFSYCPNCGAKMDGKKVQDG